VMDKAHQLALDTNDISFLIQKYTGSRLSEHCGLRFSDINMQDRTIRFVEYQLGKIDRRLKGGEKDERVVPMHDKLHAYLMAMKPELVDDNRDEPIFRTRWTGYHGVFGSKYSTQFTKKYGFTTHELRANVVSQLMMLNVSPYLLFEVTRHKIPGMSAVVSGYTRPTMDELREVVNRLT